MHLRQYLDTYLDLIATESFQKLFEFGPVKAAIKNYNGILKCIQWTLELLLMFLLKTYIVEGHVAQKFPFTLSSQSLREKYGNEVNIGRKSWA